MLRVFNLRRPVLIKYHRTGIFNYMKFKKITLDGDSVLSFGKYKGEYLKDVADADPDYIVWLHENTDYTICEFILKDVYNEVDDDG